MLAGIGFFPSQWPEAQSGADYFDEALRLSVLGERFGYDHVRIVEHYFGGYGGYSPNPIVFLSAVAALTSRLRLVTGCVIPAFSHPLKLAGECSMLDAISNGRAEIGFARAFLPAEFDHFGVSMDESRTRFDQGVEAVLRLWTEEDTTYKGDFYEFGPVTSLPRPTQRPHPPVYIAAVMTPESFARAGELGHRLMIVPYISPFEQTAANVARYREAWAAAGHEGEPHIQVSLHCCLAETDDEAFAVARPALQVYADVMQESVVKWADRESSDYRGYSAIVTALKALTFEKIIHENRALIGSPARVRAQLRWLFDLFGPFEASLQVNMGGLGYEPAARTLELFAAEVKEEVER